MMNATARAFLLAPALALSSVAPARAEHLAFQHAMNPAIGAAFEPGNEALVYYDNSNPDRIFDRIVVRGTSQQDWSEALEIVTRPRNTKMPSARDWYAQIAAEDGQACHSAFQVVAEDETSITFSREAQGTKMPGCTQAGYGLYRIVAGRRSLFLLDAASTSPLEAGERDLWLKVLATATVAK